MIRLGENRINKVGGSNKLYFDNGVVYQSYSLISTEQPDIPDSDLSLPDVPFLINYNAKNYQNGTLYNVAGAIYDKNATLSAPAEHFGDYIKLNGSQYYVDSFSSADDNPFNRTSNTQPLTIIAKAKPQQGSIHRLFGNRGDDYNYMVLNGVSNFWLHTKLSTETSNMNVPIDYSQPNIFAFRTNNTGYGFAENYTTNVKGDTKIINWGGKSNGIGLFCGGNGWEFETFLGDFYWLYISPEELTDEQVLQVISYNEGNVFGPSIPEEPETGTLDVEFVRVVKEGASVDDIMVFFYNEDETVTVALNFYRTNEQNDSGLWIRPGTYYIGGASPKIYGDTYSWIKVNGVTTYITENVGSVIVEHLNGKYKIFFNNVTFGDIIINEIEYIGNIENLIVPESDEWVELTNDFSKTTPFQTIRIDMNGRENDAQSYYFIRFSTTPNGFYDNIYYSVCPQEDSIYDNRTKYNITNATDLGDNIYEYTFSNVIYLGNAEKNASLFRIKVKPL